MAKQGFSYYKAETDRFQDIKIKRLKKKHRCAGYAVYQYLLNEIYRVQGYCLQFTEDHLFDVSEYWDIDELQVTEIVGYCAEIGLFNARLWQEKSVLTARSIQARYIDICKVCKKTPVIEEEFRLVETEKAVQPHRLCHSFSQGKNCHRCVLYRNPLPPFFRKQPRLYLMCRP